MALRGVTPKFTSTEAMPGSGVTASPRSAKVPSYRLPASLLQFFHHHGLLPSPESVWHKPQKIVFYPQGRSFRGQKNLPELRIYTLKDGEMIYHWPKTSYGTPAYTGELFRFQTASANQNTKRDDPFRAEAFKDPDGNFWKVRLVEGLEQLLQDRIRKENQSRFPNHPSLQAYYFEPLGKLPAEK